MKITLYSTGCPQCTVLKTKLDQNGFEYTLVTGQEAVEAITALGFKSAPILQVGDQCYKFMDAVKWMKEIG